MNTLNVRLTCAFVTIALFIVTRGQIVAQDSTSNNRIFSDQRLSSSLTVNQNRVLQHIVERPTTIDLRFVTSQAVDRLQSFESITVDIFSHTNVQFRRGDFKQSEYGNVWNGFTPNGDNMLIVFQGNDVLGTVRMGHEVFKIEPLGLGLHVIVKMNQQGFPQDKGDVMLENAPASVLPGTSIGQKVGPLSVTEAHLNSIQTNARIEVLVAYTAAAALAVGNIILTIQDAVVNANQSYANSEIGSQLVLDYVYQVDYAESGSIVTDLSRFYGTSDGYMDEVHGYRSTCGADVCVLITQDDASYCGYSVGVGASYSTAFAAVRYDCAAANYTFAHEIGHLESARHQFQDDPRMYPYSQGHGFCSSAVSAKTVMAIDIERSCWGCTRIGYWSGPGTFYDGTKMGNADTANNVYVLNQTSDYIGGLASSSNIYVPDDYQSVSSALASASNGQTVVVNGTQSNVGSLTIPTGVTLRLNAGTTMTFLSSSSLNANGNFSALGTQYAPVVLGPANGTWGGIVVNSGGNADIQYANISHASPAIYLNSVSSAQTIKNCSITNCTNYGIMASYSNSYKDISYNTIDNAGNAIYLYYASAAVDHNTINNTSYQTAYGIYSYGGGGSWNITNNTVTAYDAPFYANYYSTLYLLNVTYGAGGHNKAATGSVTLLADYNSNIQAGGYGGIQGLNSFYGGGMDPQVVALDYSTVVARYNWWGNDGYSEYKDQTSTIQHEPDLDYDPNGGMGKISPTVVANAGSQITSKTASSSSDPPLFEDALDVAPQSLPQRDLELEGISFINAKQYSKAANVFETIKSNYVDRPETYKHALFNLVNLYRGRLADNAKAKENLYELKAKYPKDILTCQAAVMFGEQATLPEQREFGKEQTVQTPEKTALLNNYPNPFNPTTTIQYRVDVPGQVRLAVYDILGREVTILVDSHKGAGSYSVAFDASGLTSGIYFTRLTAGGKTMLQKMLFLK